MSTSSAHRRRAASRSELRDRERACLRDPGPRSGYWRAYAARKTPGKLKRRGSGVGRDRLALASCAPSRVSTKPRAGHWARPRGACAVRVSGSTRSRSAALDNQRLDRQRLAVRHLQHRLPLCGRKRTRRRSPELARPARRSSANHRPRSSRVSKTSARAPARALEPQASPSRAQRRLPESRSPCVLSHARHAERGSSAISRYPVDRLRPHEWPPPSARPPCPASATPSGARGTKSSRRHSAPISPGCAHGPAPSRVCRS